MLQGVQAPTARKTPLEQKTACGTLSEKGYCLKLSCWLARPDSWLFENVEMLFYFISVHTLPFSFLLPVQKSYFKIF